MYVLSYEQEDEVMETANKYHYTLNRRVEFHEQRIVNENDEVEYVVQLWAYDNKRDFTESNPRFKSDKEIILEDMGNLGLEFIKQYSMAYCEDIVRVLCFRKKE